MQIRLSLLLFILLSNLIIPKPVSVNQNGGKSRLVSIGGDYSNIAPATIAAIANAKDGLVNILVLPIATASDANAISSSERKELIEKAGEHRLEIEQSCMYNAPDLTCNVVLAPVFTRPDAHGQTTLGYFRTPITEIFILDGNPKIAMDVIGGTQMELALDRAYQAGVIIAGTGAGSVIQSTVMMGGYAAGYNAENSLDFGAADVWNSAEKHGLLFGIQNAILDTNFLEDNHFGRLLNAITMPDTASIGIGIDANTSADLVDGRRIENISGSGTVAILDAATYHASTSVKFVGSRHLLSIRNIVLSLLAPGNYSYDLIANRSSLHTQSTQIKRAYEALRLPPGAGNLWLAGELRPSSGDNQILENFVKSSGGTRANILIVAIGYPSDNLAQSTAVEFAQKINANTSIYIVHQGVIPQDLLTAYTGILLTGGEQSLIEPEKLLVIKNYWLSGKPLILFNSASAIAGEYYVATPTWYNTAGLVAGDTSSEKGANIRPGMELLPLTIQPGVLNDNLWGSYLSLSYNHPELISIGLNDQTAIEFTTNSVTARGENVIFVLDLRSATLARGNNNAYVIANGLLDSFAPDEAIQPAVADSSSEPERLSTPDIATPTATPISTSTPTITATPVQVLVATLELTPTKRVRPSPTPMIIPPPSDPATRSMMVAFGVLIALLVAIGVWINRKRVF